MGKTGIAGNLLDPPVGGEEQFGGVANPKQGDVGPHSLSDLLGEQVGEVLFVFPHRLGNTTQGEVVFREMVVQVIQDLADQARA
jgi:hypothetical protein